MQPALISFNNSGKSYTIGGNPIVGTGGVIMNGTGSVTLNNANTFSGGVFVNSGTLNIGNASAIGTGRLTLQSGTTIDNTSGAALTLTTNNPQTWNGDINFTGTNSLNLGTGAVTVNAGASQANANFTTINVNASTLTVGGAISNNSGFGLFKTGLGNLALNGGGNFPGQSRIVQGTLTVNGATGTNLNFSSGTAPTLMAGIGLNENSSIFVNSGTLSTASEIWLGSNTNAYGSLTVNGGAVNAGSWLAMGRGNQGGTLTVAGVGLVNINGGTVTEQTNNVTIGSYGIAGGGGIGQLTVNPGGTLATTGTAGIFAGEYLPGTLNVLGNGTTQATVNNIGASAAGLQVAVQGQNPFGVVNLGSVGGTTTNNGLIITPRIRRCGDEPVQLPRRHIARQQFERWFHDAVEPRLHLR